MARKKTAKTALATRANADASTDMSERGRGSKKANELNPHALHLLRAADHGERKGTIAGLAEAATIVQGIGGDSMISAHHARDLVLAELRRRYGADDPMVLEQLKLRGLA